MGSKVQPSIFLALKGCGGRSTDESGLTPIDMNRMKKSTEEHLDEDVLEQKKSWLEHELTSKSHREYK